MKTQIVLTILVGLFGVGASCLIYLIFTSIGEAMVGHIIGILGAIASGLAAYATWHSIARRQEDD